MDASFWNTLGAFVVGLAIGLVIDHLVGRGESVGQHRPRNRRVDR
jgi:hypothetical protein